MTASIQRAVVAGLVLCVVACGESRAGRMPTGATPPDPLAKFQPVRIVSGADFRPVPRAAVAIEGNPYVSDANGDVVPDGSLGAGTGSSIDVDAPGSALPTRARRLHVEPGLLGGVGCGGLGRLEGGIGLCQALPAWGFCLEPVQSGRTKGFTVRLLPTRWPDTDR